MRKPGKLLAVMIWFGSAQASADVPRTLASGAPACGNTMGKGQPSAGTCGPQVMTALADGVRTVAVELAGVARDATHTIGAHVTPPIKVTSS